MNSSTAAVALNANTVPAVNALVFAQISRTLARNWDMLTVVALMLSSAAYGFYALTCLTGF